MAACELLHSLVLVMVGRSATDAGARARGHSAFHKLFARVFPALLRLATDVEPVARQLFRPLVLQLVHWFSRGDNRGGDGGSETGALLDACIAGVGAGDRSNGALREFCARCLAEFLHWAIKQSSKRQLSASPVAAAALLARLQALLRHPDPQRRLGGAKAFTLAYATASGRKTSVYRDFREEGPLVDRFALELAHTAVTSLRLSHGDACRGTRAVGTCLHCLCRRPSTETQVPGG